MTGAWRSGPLAVRSFRWLCGGQFASTIGDYCYAVALPWLVALTLLLIPRRPADGSVAAEATAGTAGTAGPDGAGGGVLSLLRRSRELQVILVVVIAANLASGGMGDVALPALAHASYGAAGYGALLACFAVGGIAGTLAAARTGNLQAPAKFASAVFLIEAAAIALVPYLGGEAGAAAMLGVVGACNGLGNVTMLTVVQKRVSPGCSAA